MTSVSVSATARGSHCQSQGNIGGDGVKERMAITMAMEMMIGGVL